MAKIRFRKAKARKSGFMSIPFVILCMIGLITFITIFTEFQHQMTVRSIEAAADLAAVESLRSYVDETSLREGKLYINPNNYDNVRDLFLLKLRASIPDNVSDVVAIEIPSVNQSTGQIELPAQIEPQGDNHTNYPNSKTNKFEIAHVTENTLTNGATQRDQYLGYNVSALVGEQRRKASSCAPMTISSMIGVSEGNNKGVSGVKPKQTYVMNVKVLVIFKTTSLLNRSQNAFLKYFNFLNNEVSVINTPQVKRADGKLDTNYAAITIQSVGEVVLR